MFTNDLSLARGREEAVKAFRAHLTPRQVELETLERYADGKQYEGKPSWWDTSAPLWDRAPCIVYKIAKIAIESNVDLVLGESRFATLSSNPGEDDSEAEGLDEEASKAIDRAIQGLHEQVRFRYVSRQAFAHAQESKSVAVLCGTRSGRLFLELFRSRWCEPTFDGEGRCVALDVRYPFLAWEKEPDGGWRVRTKLYRRRIDAAEDVTYHALPAAPDGREPPPSAWVADPARTVRHGLGFAPLHWYALTRDCSPVGEYDGHAVHEDALEAMTAIDFALSMRHEAVLFTGSPQIVEIGVAPGYDPSQGAPGGYQVDATASGGAASSTNPVTSRFESQGPRTGRIKSPGVAWQYEATKSEVEVKYLQIGPEAIKALDEHVADLRNKLSEDLAVTLLDSGNVHFTKEMSGIAVLMLKSRQFDRCDIYREDLATGWLIPVTLLLIRVALTTRARVPALRGIEGQLAPFVADDGEAPLLFARWMAPYVKLTPQEEKAVVDAVVEAITAGIITRRMALDRLKSIFGIANVDQALEALLAERDEEQSRALEQAKAQAALEGPGSEERPGGSPPAKGSDV